MDNMDVVKEIVQKDFKSGVSAKTGKPWAMHKYRTNSGKEFTSFDDLQEGDTVKLTYSEEYKNWNGGRIRKQDTQHDEIMAKLDKIIALLDSGKKPNTLEESFPPSYAKPTTDEPLPPYDGGF